jgi:3D-(3,5/4)-trihydroxycyclohexane-1,2-dione acylhydrolase (decyclizing)
MLHSELLTSIQEGRKITVILLDNHGFQCIHNLQRGHGSGGFGNEFRYRSGDTNRLNGDYLPVDFTLIAKGLGVKAYSAGTIEELLTALASAKDDARSVLIEVKVLPGTNTDGYESWWRVGVAEVSESAKVSESYQDALKKIETVKKY